jgi:hypothetical protein
MFETAFYQGRHIIDILRGDKGPKPIQGNLSDWF